MTTRTEKLVRLTFLSCCSSVPVAAQDPAAVPDAASVPAAAATAPSTWEWVEDWGRLPEGEELGSTHGCLCVDGQGRIYANTDTDRAVAVFSAEGRLLGSWGKEYRGGLHGMHLRREGDREFLYLAHTGRHEVLKTSLDGEVQWTLGWPEGSGIYAKEDEYRPTAVAVSKDGRLFVADGYGKSWIHVYDQDRSYVKSFGGPGREDGKLQTPHGLWLDTRGERELLLVCDRENHRLQWFTLDGEFVRSVSEGLRRPCNVWPLPEGGMAVADLTGRVALLDRDDRPVEFLGDAAPKELRATNQVARTQWQIGVLFAPHAVCLDARGDLYVMDWNATGRLVKFARKGAAGR